MATYKTGWLRLPSDAENFKGRFAWSHVKSIFYDKAKNILLKKKLDDMDSLISDHADAIANKLMTNDAFNTAIADYVTKAMMSSTQVNDANHVPTSSLAYAMQQAITANANAITQLNSDLGSKLYIGKKRYTTNDYASLAMAIAKLRDGGYVYGVFDIIGMPEFGSVNWTYCIHFYRSFDSNLVVVQAYRLYERNILLNILKSDNGWNFSDWVTL